ncbi:MULTISPECIES: hypothetical protein [Proteus]|nr:MULTISPECIES: hypothetical protein [Proteus]MBA7797588.1 hypothetical protein [Citrobacter sp. RHBSTW-01065]SSL80324.1 Uncharacterised protein [Klebsiella pneumoniae]ATC76567.1 hypothetical protein BG257_18850 [Proteus mirabilis]ATC78224.1 hypothetical protein BG029_07160 [Proteus mirabilis]AVB29650.1 hypothetical protein C3940_05535 [Proteus mirabilis]
MNTERIAFLHPYNPSDDESPLLSFDCDEIPVVLDFHFKVFMLDLKDDEPISLQNRLFRIDGEKITPICDPKSILIKVKDTQGKPNEVMASIKLTFEKCKFIEEGTYFIESSFIKNAEMINSNRAYFKVSKTNE